MRILSLFDGISACQVALNNIGIKYDYYASEIDKYAIQITQKNFPNTVQLGDIKELEISIEPFNWIGTVKNEYLLHTGALISSGCWKNKMLHIEYAIDLLCGGSPCQDLSIAKKDRKGLEGERSGLFYEYVRILNEVKPKFFILENVASMSKEVKDTITKELFGIEPILINSALVSAQQRKRFFWVGALQKDGTYKKVEIEQPQDRGILLKDILESGNSFNEKSYCIDASCYKGSNLENTLNKHKRTLIAEPICVASRGRNIIDGKRVDIKGAKTEQRFEPNLNGKTNCLTTVAKDNLILETIRLGHFNKGGQGDRIYSVEGKSVCLSANGGGRGAKTGPYKVPNDIINFNKNQQKKYDAMQVDCDKSNCLTEAIGRGGSSSEFISSCKKKTLAFNKLHKIDLPDGEYHIRKLTPNECARLQGFPDNYHNGISYTQSYKCYGNSFTVPVIEHILKTILNIYETKKM